MNDAILSMMQRYHCVNSEDYENALKESEAAQKYAEKVANFVREGFTVEE